MDKTVMTKISVETWYLYFDTKFEQQIAINNELYVELWKNPNTIDYLKLYRKVGEECGWTGRLLLSDDELKANLDDQNIEVWRYFFNNEVIGFFEIDHSEIDKAEIVYLGLIHSKTGKGLGKQLLAYAVEKAIEKNNAKVWLHTCEFDHENALSFYIKNGFIIEKKQTDEEYYPTEFLKKMKSNHK